MPSITKPQTINSTPKIKLSLNNVIPIWYKKGEWLISSYANKVHIEMFRNLSKR